MGDEYLVKTHIFEGPLDTLLSLIEKRKLFINDISLAQVADDYIAHARTLQDDSHDRIGDLAQFILVASTLVLIKSKSLLPQLSLTEDEQHSIEDLEARLHEYQKYKALATHLRDKFGIHTEYMRQMSGEKIIVFSPDKNTTVQKMQEIIQSVIRNIPQKELVPKAIVQKVISLEEMIESLTERITSSLKMSFRDFAKVGKTEKVNIIVSFLAMLELVKQGIIHVRQDKDFHDIEMETHTSQIPNYSNI